MHIKGSGKRRNYKRAINDVYNYGWRIIRLEELEAPNILIDKEKEELLVCVKNMCRLLNKLEEG